MDLCWGFPNLLKISQAILFVPQLPKSGDDSADASPDLPGRRSLCTCTKFSLSGYQLSLVSFTPHSHTSSVMNVTCCREGY